jgi:acetyl-CoA C-acetyltransferase
MSVYILGAARTPSGTFMGPLSTVTAPKLGATAIQGAIRRSNVEKNNIQSVFMGNVIQAGVGQAPARQAAIFAGLSDATTCVTVNKVCGSGMEAVIQASRALALDDIDLAVAGGMENMSLAPHLIPAMRSGLKFGEGKIRDAMQWDGLWDVYTDRAMGNCAEECVSKYSFTRAAQDEFAVGSFKKAQAAITGKIFESEIEAVSLKVKGKDTLISEDDGPMKANFEKMATLSPAFEKTGTITAANASTINDGAAALVLGGEKYKSQAKFKVVSYAGHAMNPTWFTIAPVEAIKKNLEKAKMNLSQIDLFEINEAFAVVTMVTMKELNIDASKVNIYGGGVSLGHPIGCSGARILVTLMNALERQNKKFGLAAICIGGGEALSIIIERIK